MRTKITAGLIIALLAAASSFAATPDRKGCKGDSLFTRMPGTFVNDCVSSDFDTQSFNRVPKGQVKLEGRYLLTRYKAEPGVNLGSRVQVLRNHKLAADEIGGALLFENERYACFKFSKDGKEITAEVDAAINGGYIVRIIEKQAMKKEISGNSDLFLKSIRDTGHVAVYGIYFDTGLAALKPASAAALAEITKLLKQDPELNVYVVGHTDNTGGMAANMKLSQARAAAVVAELVSKYGIEQARLKSAGVASLVPLSTNRNEDGRAKNRRVELVEQ